ncbi:all trans-polyprenyl-diphosphate synthase PDSS2 [Aplochiton taeniatus]
MSGMWPRLSTIGLINRGHRNISLFSNTSPSDWNKVVSDAEKIVGYPTSFMSLRCLLSDELSNVAMHVRKLVGTKHPLLNTARGFVYDSKNNLQMRGLVVLLMSKAAGPSHSSPLLSQDMVSGIYPRLPQIFWTDKLLHMPNTGICRYLEQNVMLQIKHISHDFSRKQSLVKMIDMHFLSLNIAYLIISSQQLRAEINSEKGVSSAVDLCGYHGNKALEAIQAFPSSEARSALENIASAVTKF